MSDKKVTKKPVKKRRRRIKLWQVILILALIAMISVLGYFYFSTANDSEPVYGERCASLVKIDEEKLEEAAVQIEQYESVLDVSYEVNCRILEVRIDYVDGATTDGGRNVALELLHLIDDGQGYNKEDGATWSELFNTSDDVSQYNISILLTSGEQEDYPQFGTKLPLNDEVSWTTASPADQATTDEVTSDSE